MVICNHNIFKWNSERRILILLLLLYAGVFLVEIVFYFFSKSSLVLAESFHVLSDSLIYIFALWSSYKALAQQIFWSKLIGFLQISMGLWVMASSVYHYIYHVPSDHHFVIWAGLLSLVANTISLFLVSEYKNKTLYFKVSWIFLRNDFLIKFSVLCSGILMEYYPSAGISLFMSLVIAIILIVSGRAILNQTTVKTNSLAMEG